MWYKIKIYDIVKDGINSLIYDLDGKKRILSFYLWCILIPLGLGIFCFFQEIVIAREFANYAITTISIFTALVFGILFIGPDKFSARVEMFGNNKDEEVVNYLIRYKNFTKQFIAQISFIIISILLIILLALVLYLPAFEAQYIDITAQIWWVKLISTLIFILGYLFFVLLLVLLSNIYTMMNDDININLKKRK